MAGSGGLPRGSQAASGRAGSSPPHLVLGDHRQLSEQLHPNPILHPKVRPHSRPPLSETAQQRSFRADLRGVKSCYAADLKSVCGIKYQHAQGLGCFPRLVGSKPGRLGDDDTIYLDPEVTGESAYESGDMSSAWENRTETRAIVSDLI